jgi:PAS domain S-box-containing protein
MNAVITGSDITNELDVILAHKRTVQLSEFTGISLSEQTKLATAISEICRNCLEYAHEGKISHEIVEKKGIHYLQSTITDNGTGIAQEKLEQINNNTYKILSGRGYGLTYAKKLADYCDIKSDTHGTEIHVGVIIPNKSISITAEKIIEWRDFFKNEPPISPYDELKRRNTQLISLTEELNQKNVQLKETVDQLTASEESFSFIAQNVPDVIWKANSKGEIEYVNNHWITYTGKTASELENWGWLSFIHPDEIKEKITFWKHAISERISFSNEFRLKNAKGEYFWHILRAKVIPHNDSGDLSWVGTITNIDEQKQNSLELENKVSDSTKELEITTAEMIRFNLDLEQFAYVTSHDMKEPVRMVSNFATMLNERHRDKLDADGREIIDFILEGANRMRLVISDLLSYANLGKGGTEMHLADTNEVLDDVKKSLKEKLDAAGVVINSHDLPKIMVMGSCLYQLFYNLVENAIKFRDRESALVIEISVKQVEDFWQFSVKDNGIGMDKQYADRIFKIFQRLHAQSKYPGTGIGLAICKKISELHGGRIWVESSQGIGSEFCFTLPV